MRPSDARELLRRPIRSYVLRSGRLTEGQRRALDGLKGRFGLPGLPADPVAVFGRAAPCVLEIGFGNGEGLLQRAAADPGRDYLGLEVHRPGIGHALLGLERNPLANVRLIEGDAVQAISGVERVFSEVCIWFPDPWPKKRHHKRRLVQPGFVARLAEALRPAGILHLATDHPEYAQEMRAVVLGSGWFVERGCPVGRRPETRFARRARAAGRTITDLCYERLDEHAQAIQSHPERRAV
ncbi:MAG: tRNA (guanosine(46)-N7)-methyltransferase TrmB [Acidiferrobacteraceae bacterium]